MQAQVKRYCGWVKYHKNDQNALFKHVKSISFKATESGKSLMQTEYPFTDWCTGYHISVLKKFIES